MNANTTVVEHVCINMKDSGANVLESTFKYSKSIGKLVAEKEGLSGDDAIARAEEIKRTLRRVRLALESR
jgi:hypothetical protein